ncbi:MAG: hypothetical protein JOZ24_09505, partial [Candidatus Eremiobacteraeota bacterium]|nr:hypothetical protein [Candidatus Eremiobacteraeota bacterium]
RDAEGRDAFVRRATAELYGLLERTIKADPSVWDSWFTLVSRVGTDAPTTGVLAEIPDAERVLGTPVRFDSERVEAFESPFGPLLAQIDRGSVLVRTETLDALLETVHGQTLGDLIEDLAPRFPEPAVLEAVLALASEGFLVAS